MRAWNEVTKKTRTSCCTIYQKKKKKKKKKKKTGLSQYKSTFLHCISPVFFYIDCCQGLFLVYFLVASFHARMYSQSLSYTNVNHPSTCHMLSFVTPAVHGEYLEVSVMSLVLSFSVSDEAGMQKVRRSTYTDASLLGGGGGGDLYRIAKQRVFHSVPRAGYWNSNSCKYDESRFLERTVEVHKQEH